MQFQVEEQGVLRPEATDCGRYATCVLYKECLSLRVVIGMAWRSPQEYVSSCYDLGP